MLFRFRSWKHLRCSVSSSGMCGAEIEKVKAEVQKLTDKKLIVDIKEVKRPDRDAQLVAENIALQLENRISFSRAMKSTMQRTMRAGAKGIKTSVSGRLGGADMARTVEFFFIRIVTVRHRPYYNTFTVVFMRIRYRLPVFYI